MAWWVVLGHISLSFNWQIPLIDQNSLAVSVFVLLSGFVIARLIDRKGEPYPTYIVRRGFRLFPIYLVALAVSAMLLPVQSAAWSSVADLTSQNTNRMHLAELSIENLLVHLLAHVTLFQGLIPNHLLPSAPYTIIGQAWSISLEWQFYLLAPFYMWAAASGRRWLAALLLLFGLIAASRFMPNAFLGNKMAHFGVGICSYLAFDRPHERQKWLLFTLAFAALAILMSGLIQVIPLAIWAVVLLSAAAPHRRWAHLPATILGSKPLAHLGNISYSVYLVHMIPLYCSIYLLDRSGFEGVALQGLVFACTIAVTYFLSRVTYELIEKPGISLGARLTSPPSAAVAQAA
jgi:peptidoglycan/LPS O-acetylase OafA/YrhL